MNFNDLKYERPNYEEYQKKIHRLAEQMQAAEAVQEPQPETDGGSQVAREELDSYRRAQQVERSARERAVFR